MAPEDDDFLDGGVTPPRTVFVAIEVGGGVDIFDLHEELTRVLDLEDDALVVYENFKALASDHAGKDH